LSYLENTSITYGFNYMKIRKIEPKLNIDKASRQSVLKKLYDKKSKNSKGARIIKKKEKKYEY